MTTHGTRCTLICCTFDRERANRGPGRRNLTPLYSPPPVCRHRGGTADCETACWDIFGDSFHTIPLYSPVTATRDAVTGGSTPEVTR